LLKKISLLTFTLFSSLVFSKEIDLKNYKSKSYPTKNNLRILTEGNSAVVANEKNALFPFQYQTEFLPEETTFFFQNQSKIHVKNYLQPKKVFIKIEATAKEKDLDKFLYSSLATIFIKKKIEIVEVKTLAEEIIKVDAKVSTMPQNFLREIKIKSYNQKNNLLWEVDISSPGKLESIRRMTPSMMLSAQDFLMKDVQSKNIEIPGVKVRDFFFEVVAAHLGTPHSIINF
jgi:hypothetical protein